MEMIVEKGPTPGRFERLKGTHRNLLRLGWMSFSTPGPSRRSGCAYGGRLRSDSTRTTRWHVHPPDRAHLSPHPAEDPAGPRRVRAPTLYPDRRPTRTGPRAVPPGHRSDPDRRRGRATQAAAYRRPGVPAAPRRAQLRRRLRPGATLPAAAPSPTSRNLHPAGTSPGPPPRGRFRSHPRRLPRRTTPGLLPGHDLGLLQRPLRHGAAVRADRGDPRGHGRRLRVLRPRPRRSLVGQPQDGGDVDPPGARAPAPPALRGAGRSFCLRSPLLHAGAGKEKPDAD